MSTKIISETPILDADLFTVNDVHLELRNGETRNYKNVYRKPAIMVLPITEQDEVILIRQYRYMHRAFILEAVAGFINEKESRLDAAKRELKEEAGYETDSWKELTTSKSAGSIITWDNTFFVAKDLKKVSQELEADEDIRVMKLPLSEAISKVLSGEITNEPTMVHILMVELLRQRGEL